MLAGSAWALAAVVLLAFFPAPLDAASDGGKGVIKGVVRSPAGEALAHVKIIAFNLDTGVAYEAKSGAGGVYELSGLGKGDYELTAIAEGFDIFGSEEIKVTGKKPVTYDIELVELFQRTGAPVEDP